MLHPNPPPDAAADNGHGDGDDHGVGTSGGGGSGRDDGGGDKADGARVESLLRWYADSEGSHGLWGKFRLLVGTSDNQVIGPRDLIFHP